MKKLFNLRNNKFFRNSLMYTIGSMLTPIAGFIILPIYTNYLSPSEYGIMTTVQTLSSMVQILLALALAGAITRFYYDYLDDETKQKKYLGSIFGFVFAFSSVVSVILLLSHQFIGDIIFNNIPIKPYYFYMVGIAWLSSLVELPMALFRAQEKAGTFISLNALRAIGTMLVTAYLIINKGFGAEGALIAQLVLSIMIILVAHTLQWKNFILSFKLDYIKASLLFSIPLLPHTMSGWIINSADRIILEKYVTLGEIGVYSLAIQVSAVLGLFYSSVNNALVPRYTILRKNNSELEAKKLLKIFLLIVIVSGLLSIPFALLGTKLITSSDYHEALILIPILLVGQIINGLYFIPVANLFYTKSTKSIATSSATAALINIVINILLIPYIGIWGAVWATVISQIIRLLLIYYSSRKINLNYRHRAF